MKIGLIDVDGHNFPNLPLMKLSAWHKKQGDDVGFYDLWDGIVKPYDRVYMSKVFSFTPNYQAPIYANEVIGGGSGYCIDLEDGKEVYHAERDKNLPDEIEHIYPDYDLYRETERAIGFTTRGCPRGCGFCHVASKEGKCSYKVADIDEFWKGQKEICLCDPNLLACKDHMELLQQLVDSKAKIDFNQGLDVRMITDKNLELLRQCKLKTIHFAYDRYEDKKIVEPKLKAFKEATGYKRGKVLVYILCNFGTTLEEDLERIAFVRSLEFSPYVTVYDLAHADPIYKKLQRWCNNYYVFWAEPDFYRYQK
jgi:hypothetical protein